MGYKTVNDKIKIIQDPSTKIITFYGIFSLILCFFFFNITLNVLFLIFVYITLKLNVILFIFVMVNYIYTSEVNIWTEVGGAAQEILLVSSS